MINTYILGLGIALAALGTIELSFPERAFRAWKRWVENRFFPLHGVLLIAVGFPLTFYRGPFAGAVFSVGLFIVVTAPFIIVYPEKIRKMFHEVDSGISPAGIKTMVLFEAFVRIAVGALFIATHFMK